MLNKDFNIYKSYIYTRRKIFISYIGTVFFICLPVYSAFLKPDPLLYGIFLSFVFMVFFIVYDYLKYKKDCMRLQRDCAVDLDNILSLGNTEADPKLYIFYMANIIKHYEDILEKKDNDFSEMQNFYTVWTHQIKIPISVIKLLEAELPKNLGTQVQEEIFRIEGYVDLLLNYMRLNSKSSDYLFREYSLDMLIKTSIRKYSHIFIKKKLTLDYEAPDISIVSDEKWFCFMFEQLLSNALKYTNKGGISIGIKDKKKDENFTKNDLHKGRYAVFIKDSGIGIAAEDLPRIQEFGYTGANGRLYSKSTGIGLALCKKISQALSIELEIKSELNKGTVLMLHISDRLVS